MTPDSLRFHQENEETDTASSSLSPPCLILSSIAPSLSSHNWTHDVFPSFHGEDVRIEFLSHIKKEFQRKGITPFIDNEIKRGESIGPELIRAIRASKIAIILLSRNYASSKWCLDELVEIMTCRKELGRTAMAIFYKVDPSDVKKLAGDFGKVFRNTCKGKSTEDINRWKEALTEVATIAGYHSINWNNEADMIEEIATDVSNELINSVPSNDFNNLIGMEAHMENLEPLLRLDLDEVRIIGIWGLSGIGKSTIARFLFSKHSHRFQLSIFMDNIKRRYPRPYSDEYSVKLKLQTEFLSQVISQKDVNINHLGVIQERLRNQRVLVVLDDVDHLLQLDAVAKNPLWFGPRSRIIITTQDKKILNQHRINHIYQVRFPVKDEDLQIFCMNAFCQSSPFEGFEDLAQEATQLCGNLPLGLKVMGSHFKGMDKHDWEEELPRLRTNLDGDIESIFMFSYEALSEEDKSLFLYIACFFNNQETEKVETHLATRFSNVRRGLRVLAEKSLISIFFDSLIDMHDLLVLLGKQIVRKQSIQDLEKRQFLFDDQDISQVLNNDAVVNRNIIGINSKHYEIEDELYKSDRVLERMYSLQFLRVRSYSKSKFYLPQSSYRLPPKLKLLHWEYFPMKMFPSSFNLEFLVELNMSNSKLEKMWEGIQMIQNLNWIDLSDSRDLKELPDLSTATNLKELKLSYCSSLVELPSSIGNSINLKKLDLMGCSYLVELPSSIGNAIKLKQLNLMSCSSLVKLPTFIGNAANFKILHLKYCSSLVKLPSCIGDFINLKELNLKDCKSLVKLPHSIGNAINLKKLDLEWCSSLQKLPYSIGNIINLEILNLKYCSNLVRLPFSIGNAINLKELNLRSCHSLVGLPYSIGNAINLKKLDLSFCLTLAKLPSSIGPLHSLIQLNIESCRRLHVIPANINMESLDELDLSYCSELKSFPEISTNLRVLKLHGTAVKTVPSSIRLWSRIEKLTVSCSENIEEFTHDLDIIVEFHLCDTRLQEIFMWIKRIHRQHKLVIRDCEKVASVLGLPESLGFFDTENYESLEAIYCSSHGVYFSLCHRFAKCFN